MSKHYLVWFGRNNSYFNHRFSELEGLARLFGCDPSTLFVGSKPGALSPDPYAIVALPNERVAEQICSRAVIAKFIVELWGQGSSDSSVMEGVRTTLPQCDWDQLFLNKSFSYKVLAYGVQISEEKRRDRMYSFASLFTGTERVDLRNPDYTLYIIDEHEMSFGQTGTRDESISAPRKRTFYGRLVSDSNNGHRQPYALPDRPVLGPTSLDNDLAFLMANVAEIDSGKFVLDPFCGTGGLLISATACGEVPQMGTDIDVRVLEGECVAYIKNKVSEDMTKDIFENFTHYKLPIPEVFASDNSNHCWRTNRPIFDVILTDPPYGVRAGAKKIGQKSQHEVGNRDSYHPQMLGYLPNEVNSDLLSLSSSLLVDNGTLVFLQHIELIDLFTPEELRKIPRSEKNDGGETKLLTQKNSRKEYVYANECAREHQFLDEQLIIERVVPHHPDLVIENVALQILAAGTGRILVKMRRVARR
jgi:tRNA (guanine10-N2)-methyltransferase